MCSSPNRSRPAFRLLYELVMKAISIPSNQFALRSLVLGVAGIGLFGLALVFGGIGKGVLETAYRAIFTQPGAVLIAATGIAGLLAIVFGGIGIRAARPTNRVGTAAGGLALGVAVTATFLVTVVAGVLGAALHSAAQAWH
jgi:hypothetical protein